MEGVPACLLALSAAAPRCARGPVAPPAPGRMLPQGCAPTASGEDRPGPRPKQAQKPHGDARRELSRCHPRGKQRRLGPAGPPPRAAAATRVPAGIWKRSWLAAPAALGWAVSERRGALGSALPQPRCTPPAGDADLAETGSLSSSGLGESPVFPDSEDAEVQPKCSWTTTERREPLLMKQWLIKFCGQ